MPILIDRQKRDWSRLAGEGWEVTLAVWEGHSEKWAFRLSRELNWPLYQLERGFLSRLAPGIPGAVSFRLIEISSPEAPVPAVPAKPLNPALFKLACHLGLFQAGKAGGGVLTPGGLNAAAARPALDSGLPDFAAKWAPDHLFYYLCFHSIRYAAAPQDPVLGCLAALLSLGAEQVRQKLARRRSKAEILFKIRNKLRFGRSQPSERLSALTRMCFERRHLQWAWNLGRRLLRSGRANPEIWRLMIETASLRFAFDKALILSRRAGRLFPGWRKGWFFLAGGQAALLAGKPEEGLKLLAYCFLKHNRPAEMPFPGSENKLNDIYGRLPWQQAMTRAQLAVGRTRRLNLNDLKSLLYAEDLLEVSRLAGKRPWNRSYSLLKARSLRLLGSYEQARGIMEKLAFIAPEPEIYDEALILSLNFPDDWGIRLWNEAAAKGINIKPFTAWQALCKRGHLREAFQRHAQAPYFKLLEPYLGRRRLSAAPLSGPRRPQALVLAECFTGDEIRFARLYPALARVIPAEKVVFACDPRLYELFKRSFPNLNFCPVRKCLALYSQNIGHFNSLPGADCSRYLDNQGWALAKQSDLVITVMGALAALLSDYQDLEDLPLLKPASIRQAEFKKLLQTRSPKGATMAGLSWRSSLSRYDRKLGMFSLPELAPLLEMEEFQWVNCQYDGLTEEERDYLERYFPGRLLELEIDQYHNIDETAALYAALEVMVSGQTYTTDLAGCLGINTLLIDKRPAAAVWAKPGTNRHAFMPQVELWPGRAKGGGPPEGLKGRLLELRRAGESPV